MTWISLVCLLALSSAAFGQSGYGVFSGSSLFKPKPVPMPLPSADIPLRPVPIPTSNYGSYDKFESRKLSFDLPKPATLPLSEADILCKAKPEGFVIVLLGGEKFIICTTDSKGDEFFCPKGLLYNDETKRCERKYNPNQNPCASQPCLNGGRCIPTQYSYQCDCSQGFTGRTCELDASVCQQQQPCGSSFDSFCQSFHVGSALKHVCVLQEGRAYGLTGQQAYPNPCLSAEGVHGLAFGNKGFIMCDGEHMFIQSCPGGTIWDSFTKVCVWPDIEGTLPARMPEKSGGFSAAIPQKLEVLNDIPMSFAMAITEPVALQRGGSDGDRSGFAVGQAFSVVKDSGVPLAKLLADDSSADRSDLRADARIRPMAFIRPGVEDFDRQELIGKFQPTPGIGNTRRIVGSPFNHRHSLPPGSRSTGVIDTSGIDFPTREVQPDDSSATTIDFPTPTPTANPTMDRRRFFPNIPLAPGARSGNRF